MTQQVAPGIAAIARERYADPGRHGDAHFRINPADRDALLAAVPRPAKTYGVDVIGNLLAIPMVLDDAVPVGTWRLVGGPNLEVRAEGELFPDQVRPVPEPGSADANRPMVPIPGDPVRRTCARCDHDIEPDV